MFKFLFNKLFYFFFQCKTVLIGTYTYFHINPLSFTVLNHHFTSFSLVYQFLFLFIFFFFRLFFHIHTFSFTVLHHYFISLSLVYQFLFLIIFVYIRLYLHSIFNI